MTDTINLPRLDLQKTINEIEEFIIEKINETKTDGLILGLSGGIDSTLVAFLAQKAIGSENILGITMPTSTTSKADLDDTQKVADLLGIEYEVINIDKITDSFITICPHESTKLAEGNLKARIRMSILYHHANSMNRLVIGTSNRSELLVGYFTKYGDGASDLIPIGDLYKTQVWEISQELGIPNEIIKKAPTAGLQENQTDEKELGIDYITLDKLLYCLFDLKIDDESVSRKLDLPLSEVQRIKSIVKKSEHKRKMAPILRVR